AVERNFYRRRDRRFWCRHLQLDHFDGYARPRQDRVRDLISNADHTQKKMLRTNRRTAARLSLSACEEEDTLCRFRISIEHTRSLVPHLLSRFGSTSLFYFCL